MRFVIKDCIGCGICQEECPMGAISPASNGKYRMEIDQSKCRKCGICKRECLNEGIIIEDV